MKTMSSLPSLRSMLVTTALLLVLMPLVLVPSASLLVSKTPLKTITAVLSQEHADGVVVNLELANNGVC